MLESLLLPWIYCILGVGGSDPTTPMPWTSTHLLGFGFFVGYELELFSLVVSLRAYIYKPTLIYINILVGPRYHQSSFQRAGISGSYLDTTPKLVWRTDVNIGSPHQTF